jgi:hypothetical protein
MSRMRQGVGRRSVGHWPSSSITSIYRIQHNATSGQFLTPGRYFYSGRQGGRGHRGQRISVRDPYRMTLNCRLSGGVRQCDSEAAIFAVLASKSMVRAYINDVRRWDSRRGRDGVVQTCYTGRRSCPRRPGRGSSERERDSYRHSLLAGLIHSTNRRMLEYAASNMLALF